MIDANSVLFSRIINFCRDRGVSVEHPAAPRWVQSTEDSKHILKNASIKKSISFGRFQHLAWIELDNFHYIGSIGFEHELLDNQVLPLDDIRGFEVCLLSELQVQPRVGPVEALNIVDFGYKGDVDYSGHPSSGVVSLFPSIRVFESRISLSEDNVWPLFMKFCVEECRLGGSWIDHDLAKSLEALASLNVPSLPYRELCRSVVDLDPRSLYMALYRCIEATYAYEIVSKVSSSLNVSEAWYEVAAILNHEMSWRPPEAQSLNVALNHADENDLAEVCRCLKAEIGQDVRASAGKAIYKLRNQIVHYRPSKESMEIDDIDWNRLCDSLVTISLFVFDRTSPGSL